VLRALAVDLAAPVNPRNEAKWLKQMWLGLGKKAASISLTDATWRMLGFRTETPAALDFEHGGVLSLKCLAFFAAKHSAKYREIARARARGGYPFVCVGVNLVCALARLTRFSEGEGDDAAESKQRFWPLLESNRA
tara:strand:- start:639 stop:1046 length:408 start_codon:yes stop_codon:yes gene_type:complete